MTGTHELHCVYKIQETLFNVGLHIQYSIQFNSIKFISTFIHHYMSIIIIIHCIFLNEKSKRICRKLNKLIGDIQKY